MMPDPIEFFATAPKGLAPLLAEELKGLDASAVKESVAGVSFSGPIETAYRACLWSRVASRVFLPVSIFPATTPEELYEAIRSIRWEDHLSPEGTLAVDCNLSSSAMTHSHYAALKVKDAVVDRFRELSGKRPTIDLSRPDLRINLHIHKDTATISLDLSGESLHRRNYREEGVEAPLKENLAAGILLYSKWPALAKERGEFVDLMCGSGTLPIEAALIAGDIAPGMFRDYFGFLGWRGHDDRVWKMLCREAEERKEAGISRLPRISGFDKDPVAIKASLANAVRAGLADKIRFEKIDLSSHSAIGASGLVVANPPYGERLGDKSELVGLYEETGKILRERFSGWRGAIFTGDPGYGKNIGIRPRRVRTLYNGAIECRLLHYDIEPRWFYKEGEDMRPEKGGEEGSSTASIIVPGSSAEMFANRIRKNLSGTGTWAKDNGITCYRIYDADIPEYAVAVDIYDRWVHVQEYEPPKSVEEEKARARLDDVMSVLPVVLGVPKRNVYLKVRRRQKGGTQYEKIDSSGEFKKVNEGDCIFLVNLRDYLDTGLFLDHRPTRFMIREMAAGKSFLNLFAYTGSATVHAAKGGAVQTTTVDMSKTYIEWARNNFDLNGLSGPRHELVQADCLEWLASERRRFDIIFFDPPTFSSSKRMKGTLDIERDHVDLLRMASGRLKKDGVMIFSNNYQRFRMDVDALPELEIEDITQKTIPRDFARNPKIHNCWRIRQRC